MRFVGREFRILQGRQRHRTVVEGTLDVFRMGNLRPRPLTPTERTTDTLQVRPMDVRKVDPIVKGTKTPRCMRQDSTHKPTPHKVPLVERSVRKSSLPKRTPAPTDAVQRTPVDSCTVTPTLGDEDPAEGHTRKDGVGKDNPLQDTTVHLEAGKSTATERDLLQGTTDKGTPQHILLAHVTRGEDTTLKGAVGQTRQGSGLKRRTATRTPRQRGQRALLERTVLQRTATERLVVECHPQEGTLAKSHLLQRSFNHRILKSLPHHHPMDGKGSHALHVHGAVLYILLSNLRSRLERQYQGGAYRDLGSQEGTDEMIAAAVRLWTG